MSSYLTRPAVRFIHAETRLDELANSPSLLVSSRGGAIIMGPYVGPGHGCLPCYWHFHDLRARWLPEGEPERAGDAAAIAVQMYERETGVDWDNTIAFLPEPGAALQFSPVLRRQDCRQCGTPPVPLDEKLKALANPLTGILTGIRVVPEAHGRAWLHGGALLPRPHQPVGASGSGATVGEARRRMVFEAVERHCAAYLDSDPSRVTGWALDGRLPAATFPATQVYYGHPAVATDTSGCAAAPTLQQAIQHGWLEVVERDAVARWWHGGAVRRRVEVPDEPGAWVLDVTPAHGVPVAVGVVGDAQGRRLYLGAAAGLEWSHAAQRAVLEARQFQLWDSIAGTPPARRAWLEKITIENTPFLAGSRDAPTVSVEEATPGGYWVDLTRAWLGIPVVRVICPGLQTLAGTPLPI